MPTPKKAYKQTLDEHRARVLRVTQKQGLRGLKRLYEESLRDLEKKLKGLPGGMKDSFTSHQYRIAKAQLRQGLRLITQRLSGAIGDLNKTAQTEALRGLIRDISQLEKIYTGADVVLPVEEAGKFRGVLRGVDKSLMRVHKDTMARLGARIVGKIEDQMSISLAIGEDLGGMIDRVMKTGDVQWYQAERIARTESIASFNLTQARGIEESSEALPDMMVRWVEYVDDESLKPLDARVSLDSIAMHGQVTSPGGVFTFPRTRPRKVPSTLRRYKWPGGAMGVETWGEVVSRFGGQQWASPPNRPNDRSSVQPWRPGWGIPAWRLVNGRVVQL